MLFAQTGHSRLLFLGAFAAVYVVWGSTYLAIAVAVQSIPPFLLIGVRSLAAGAILLGFAELRKPSMPPARAWALAATSGVLLFVGGHGTLAYAERYVPSGLAALMLATVPFWVVLLKSAISAVDRPRLATFAALIPGLAGVALFVLPARPQGVAPIAPEMVLALLGSAFLWAAGSIISQRQSASIPATTSAAMQLLCGGGRSYYEFAQRRTYRIFAFANLGRFVDRSCLPDARRIGGHFYGLCLAIRSCASAVGGDVHFR
jgi:drug/metabolite transporter (DMT)-like permease